MSDRLPSVGVCWGDGRENGGGDGAEEEPAGSKAVDMAGWDSFGRRDRLV